MTTFNVTLTLTANETAALAYWHEVSTDLGEIKDRFDVDLRSVLDEIASTVAPSVCIAHVPGNSLWHCSCRECRYHQRQANDGVGD